MRQVIFRALQSVERWAAHLQGKGYGAATIQQEVALACSFLGAKPALAIDIGGNVGDYTAELRRRNERLEIHTFEPSSVNVAKLKKRFADDPSTRILPFAVSDMDGTATLYANEPGSGLGSLVQRKLDHFNLRFDAQEQVALVRFEDYWRSELGRRRIDLVKLDIEGHELSALKGFGEAIGSIRVMQFEFGGCNIDTRTFFRDFWYFFAPLGFALYRITPLGPQQIGAYREGEEFFSTTNYVAVNENLA